MKSSMKRLSRVRITLYPEWLDEFNDVNDKRVLWDLIKYRIRQVSIKYRFQSNNEFKKKTEQKDKDRDLLCNIDPSEENLNDLDAAKYEYELLYDYVVQGSIVRSRINWYEKGEKNSKYFLNLENIGSGKTTVRRLFDSTGSITVNPQTIMNELRDYYQNVYSNQDSDLGEEFCSDFLDNNYNQ